MAHIYGAMPCEMQCLSASGDLALFCTLLGLTVCSLNQIPPQGETAGPLKVLSVPTRRCICHGGSGCSGRSCTAEAHHTDRRKTIIRQSSGQQLEGSRAAKLPKIRPQFLLRSGPHIAECVPTCAPDMCRTYCPNSKSESRGRRPASRESCAGVQNFSAGHYGPGSGCAKCQVPCNALSVKLRNTLHADTTSTVQQ